MTVRVTARAARLVPLTAERPIRSAAPPAVFALRRGGFAGGAVGGTWWYVGDPNPSSGPANGGP
jgi:hypothetical protein